MTKRVKRTLDNNPGEAMAEAFLDNIRMEEMQDYLVRGRKFEGADDDFLRRKWTEDCRSWFATRDAQRGQDFHDVNAELSLRKIEPPNESVVADLEAVQAEIQRNYDDPKFRESLQEEIAQFIRPAKLRN